MSIATATDDTLEGFFALHLERACQEVGVKPNPLTPPYMVNLLTTYANQPIDETPLALRMMEAQEAHPRERRTQLRTIGDRSLYVSGFWRESFAHRLVDVDYYIGIGETAYGTLARAPHNDVSCDVFSDLARNFPRFVRVLTVVSRRVLPDCGTQDIVALYERWTKHKSVWAREKLAAMGVVLMGDAGERLQ